MSSYEENFETAIRFTTSCGYAMEPPKWNRSHALDPSAAFVFEALGDFGVDDLSASAGKCLMWCHFMQPALERRLGRKVWLTIGQLWKGNSKVFGPTFDDMRRWHSKGIQFSDLLDTLGYDLHAWLTVESGEIIEPTLCSTLAKFAGGAFREFLGGVYCGIDSRIMPEHQYIPIAVGNEIASAIAEKSAFPLLAKTVHDLMFSPSALVMPCGPKILNDT